MKKIFILFVLALSLVIITGCAKEGDIFGSYDFENKTQHNLEQIKESLSNYQTRMDDLVDISDPYDLPLQTTYTKDELTQIALENDENSNEELMFYRTSLELNRVNTSLDSCELFEENSFCTYSNSFENIKIRVKMENNQLYIEEYRYNSNASGTEITALANMFYLNLIEDKIYIEYVRDVNLKSAYNFRQYVTYESCYQSVDYVSLNVDKNDNKLYYYYEENTTKNEELKVYNNSDNQDIYISYDDMEESFRSSIVLNEDLDITQSGVFYKKPLSTFKYTYLNGSDGQSLMLTWNLLEIQGWDRIEWNDMHQVEVFLDDDEVLVDYQINFYVGYVYDVSYTFDMNEEPLTQSILNLSNEDLLFSAISLEKLNQDKMFLEDNYMSVLKNYDFSLDSQENHDKIKKMIPFVADPLIIYEIFDSLIEI